MDLRLNKSAKATFKRGKLKMTDHVRLDEEVMIKDLEEENRSKYLGADGSRGI